ncbi:MAG: ribonuclease E/G [Myxococcaceae bacterium]
MGSTLLINAAGRETRVALVDNGHISEFYLERKKDRGIVGNIYKGRVSRVLPGMQAAFVDIGLDKAAFLYVTDVVYDPDFARSQFDTTEGEHEEAPDVPDESDAVANESRPTAAEASAESSNAQEASAEASDEAEESELEAVEEQSEGAESESAEPEEPAPAPPPSPEDASAQAAAPTSAATSAEALAPNVKPPTTQKPREERGGRRAPRDERGRRRGRPDRHADAPRRMTRIEDVLKVGQEVVVQVSKDPIGSKGARLTSHISIPGRHLVFMPTVDHIGISRRIGNEKERKRLRDTVERLRPPGTGFIVRTVAESVPQAKLESDIRFLIGVWNQVVRKNERRGGLGLMHPDLDLILRATRDLFAQDVEKLVVDDRAEYERIAEFVTEQDPALRDRVVLHDNEEPVFDAYGIEQEIQRATQRKVWLKSGGYLIIDQAEALTAIDVNSGRYVGKKSLEETITKINTEAAKEIVYQLRLRNIGGIIICDFIDMEKPQNRDRVFKTLQEALGRDKAKTNVLRISELGLVEMTRKRVRESIGRMLHEDCPNCEGQGFVQTATTVAYQIFREIRRDAANYRDNVLVINANPDVARLLQGDERDELRHLMDRYNKSIQVKAQPHYHREQYDIYVRSAQAQAGANRAKSEASGQPEHGATAEGPEGSQQRMAENL